MFSSRVFREKVHWFILPLVGLRGFVVSECPAVFLGYRRKYPTTSWLVDYSVRVSLLLGVELGTAAYIFRKKI